MPVSTCNMTPSDSTGLIFQQASEQQLNLVWTLNAAAWAAPISTEDHVIRERFLSQQDLTGQNWRTFVLFRQEDEIIASCEAFEKEILVSDKNGFRKERGFAIASVYTNPKYRRQKMANFLLRNLAEWMDGEGGGTLSVLYSDIGKVWFCRWFNDVGLLTSSIDLLRKTGMDTVFDSSNCAAIKSGPV